MSRMVHLSKHQNETWLIYALGGGWGHLNRALSLGRIAARHRRVEIITNSPYTHHLLHQKPSSNPEISGCHIHLISPNAGLERTCQQVEQILCNTSYNCLIVDTFPRGLGGELVKILPQLESIPRIFIHRDLNPEYVQVKNLHSFVQQHFNTIIVPGEGVDLPLADLPGVQHTLPWIIRNPEELPELKTARSLLQLNQLDNPVVVVCAAGNLAEQPFFTDLATQLTTAFPHIAIRHLSPHSPSHISHYPGIECFLAADAVIGAAGYNTVYECAALGVPLVAFALPRMYDRQQRRLQRDNLANCAWGVENSEEAIAAIQKILSARSSKPHSCPYYQNGAIQAEQLIRTILVENGF